MGVNRRAEGVRPAGGGEYMQRDGPDPASDQERTPPCPLCDRADARPFDEGEGRTYLHCPACRLMFVPEKFWPSPAEERRRYDQHQNAPDDAGYLSHLETLASPLAGRLPPGARGLDFGCGPEPVLCRIMEERGFATRPYDPFYFPEPPSGPFDFIASTETFEHFRHPRKEIGHLRAMLRTGGLLGVMTMFWSENAFRSNWHYRRDFTHLCFYRRETMDWICRAFGFELIWCDGRRAAILRRL